MEAKKEGVFVFTGKSIEDTNYLMHLPEHGKRSWDTYAKGYRDAAELLGEHVLLYADDVGLVNTMGLAFIYLWRHYLELRLKCVILSGGKRESSHCLEDNFNTVIGMLKKVAGGVFIFTEDQGDEVSTEFNFRKASKDDYEKIRQIIREIDCCDKASETFRYPKLRRGGLRKEAYFDLKNFAQSMPIVADLLDEISSYLSIYYDVEHEYDCEL